MLCNIGDESREEAQQLLSLLCYSPRPLLVDEVIEAIAVDLDGSECYESGRRLAGAEDLFRICPGLIEIVPIRTAEVGSKAGSRISANIKDKDQNEDEDENSVDSSYVKQIVRIAHFSVQEYLLSEHIGKSRAANFALSGPMQHGRITKLCLLYLSNDDYARQTLTPDLVKRYSFAGYAARYWSYHYPRSDGKLAEELSRRIIELFTMEHMFDHWVRLYDPDPLYDSIDWDGRLGTTTIHEPSKGRPFPMYYAALLGLESCIPGILLKSSHDINNQGGYFSNALQAASYNGYEKVVQILLDNGADIHVKGGYYDTALQAASAASEERVVQILLENGADVNAQSDGEQDVGDALHEASRSGHKNIVQILLRHGANVNAQGTCWGTALQEASFYGHKEVVQLLLDNGANVNEPGRMLGTALQAASYIGQKEIVQILLKNGAKVNAPGNSWGNALQAASQEGHRGLVQILLENGADVDAASGEEDNALHVASSAGYSQVVQLLLDRGANIDAPDRYGSTALQRASAYGRKDMVCLLIKNGANVNASAGGWGSALREASLRGSKEVVQILVANGADINTLGIEDISAMQEALDGGYERTVSMVWEWGIKKRAPLLATSSNRFDLNMALLDKLI